MRHLVLLVIASLTTACVEPSSIRIALHSDDPTLALRTQVTVSGTALSVVAASVDDAGATLEVELDAALCGPDQHAIATGGALSPIRFELADDACAVGWVEASAVASKGESFASGCQCQYYYGTYYRVCGYPAMPYIDGKC